MSTKIPLLHKRHSCLKHNCYTLEGTQSGKTRQKSRTVIHLRAPKSGKTRQKREHECDKLLSKHMFNAHHQG